VAAACEANKNERKRKREIDRVKIRHGKGAKHTMIRSSICKKATTTPATRVTAAYRKIEAKRHRVRGCKSATRVNTKRMFA
jgi:hypothetical protein